MKKKSIAVFDSGIGGLTVVHEIIRLLPNENIIYFGDCGRTPYGNRSKDTVLKYTFQNIRFLLSMDIKMIVIACNTASACSFEKVRHELGIPVVEVVKPGALAAIKKTKNRKVGIIGTKATIDSAVYQKTLNEIDNSVKVVSKACPLFVPLVEEGWWENEVTYKTIEEYLTPIKNEGIDTLVFGCTHYPLLCNPIKKFIGEEVNYINSAEEVAKLVKLELDKNGIRSDLSANPICRFFTSDSVEKFNHLSSIIMDGQIVEAEKVNIEEF